MYSIARLKRFVGVEQASEYLLYLDHNIDKDEIMFITKININDILLLSHIYTEKFNIDNDKLKFIENKIEKYKQAVKLNKPLIEKFRLMITGNQTNNVMVYYLQTINKVVKSLRNNRNTPNLLSLV